MQRRNLRVEEYFNGNSGGGENILLLAGENCIFSAFSFHNIDDDDDNNSIQFFIIYVPSQQPQGQLQTQHSVGTRIIMQ
jgi:hypothetical protein